MLFTNAEFAAYLQKVEGTLAAATINLLRELIEAEIDDLTGTVFLTAVQKVRLKRIALEATARAYRNPDRYTTQTVGSVSHGMDVPVNAGVYLTSDEISAIRDVAGNTASRRSIPLAPTFGIRTY